MERPKLSEFSRNRFDVLVVGGGITGAAVARDAALRGLRVMLTEKDDFASGTSSKSSKLVHGGLRYLEHGDLRLVMEGCRERRRLLTNARHIVHPMPFVIPVMRTDSRRPWQWRVGLWLYDVLAAFRNVERHRILDPCELRRLEPTLPANGVVMGGLYYDAAMQDARLCIETLRAAAGAGARCANYAEVVGLVRNGEGQIIGARVRDVLDGQEHELRAEVVVNAAGPWADRCAAMSDRACAPRLRLSKGVHLVTRRFTHGHAILSTGQPDGRIFVIVPWLDYTLIGTTDTDYDGSPDEVCATSDDVAYLLEAARSIVPGAHLTEDDVISTMAGVRPLLHEVGKTPSDLSRTHRLIRDPNGLISIVGGKYTTHRAMAAEAVDMVVKHLGPSGSHMRASRAPTARLPLAGCAVDDYEAFAADALRRLQESLGMAVDTARHLVSTYGAEVDRVVEPCREEPWYLERLSEGLPHILAEVVWAFEHEMAYDAADFLFRRSSIGYRSGALVGGAESVLERVAQAAERRGVGLAAERERFFARFRSERHRAIGVLGADRPL